MEFIRKLKDRIRKRRSHYLSVQFTIHSNGVERFGYEVLATVSCKNCGSSADGRSKKTEEDAIDDAEKIFRERFKLPCSEQKNLNIIEDVMES